MVQHEIRAITQAVIDLKMELKKNEENLINAQLYHPTWGRQ